MPQLTDDQRAQLEALNTQKAALQSQMTPIQDQVRALDEQMQQLMISFRRGARGQNQEGPPEGRGVPPVIPNTPPS
jgi:uncharacterized coiled-coil protein SlyX